MSERLGILGGAFDPLHNGHLILGEQAFHQLKLTSVYFVPSYSPPENHKSISTSFDQRCEMLALALKNLNHFRVSRIEAALERPTYTVRLLEALKTESPSAELFFIMGSDSLEQLDTWYHPERIDELASLAVAARPGFKASNSRFRIEWLDMPLIDISASALRERARNGSSLRFLVPDPIISYIAEHRLYRD